MGGYPEEGMPLLATVDPVWIRCEMAEGSLRLFSEPFGLHLGPFAHWLAR